MAGLLPAGEGVPYESGHEDQVNLALADDLIGEADIAIFREPDFGQRQGSYAPVGQR